MSYQGISIREVLDKINANTNGWYLPEVQRQYVWGNRNNSEDYVCLLLDSLLQGYPIGGIVVWENSAKVPFRLFLTDYASNKFNKSVEEGRWGQSKSLVYDGQQRLQTLYSVLKYTFNDRVLHYDLFFDAKNSNADETGFLFRNKDAAPELRYLKLTELCSISCSEESEAKYTIEDRLVPLYENDKEKRSIVRQNLNRLWDIFVKDNEKQIAYFPIKASSPDTANEVFRRLNIGGVSLTSVELVLSKIKAKYYDFEENTEANIVKITGIETTQPIRIYNGDLHILSDEEAKDIFKYIDVEAYIDLFETAYNNSWKNNVPEYDEFVDPLSEDSYLTSKNIMEYIDMHDKKSQEYISAIWGGG